VPQTFSSSLIPSDFAQRRARSIADARAHVLQERATTASGLTAPWVERSWQRCLQLGLEPGQRVQ